ncbi:MAG: hypothetical protein RML40_02470 [Bacteroidota bacterium]|nr:hypothetical protein [Candidatus Kapabacteria bacterium]MDW8219374.1 hypothetical protein [Bacteroidota bacterium]
MMCNTSKIMYMLLRCACLALLIIMIMSEYAEAQGGRPRRLSLGLYGTYSMDMHNVNFLELPTIPIFTPRTGGSNEPGAFSPTTAWNPAFGLVAEYALDERLSVGIRVHYATQDVRLTTRASYRVGRSDGTFANAISEYSLSDSIQILGVEPMVSYTLWEGLSVHLGVRLGFILSAKYYQVETLIEPSDGSFFSGTVPIRTRNPRTGDLPEAVTFTIAPILGLSYAIPITERLIVQPEAFLSYSLMPVVKDIEWRVHSLRPGLAVRYKL